MGNRILVIQGHPDPEAGHFGHALAEAYREGAEAAGHDVQSILVARLDFPLLRNQAEFESAEPPAGIRTAQEAIEKAEHLVFLYPLWLGDMPAVLKAFLEQTFRPAFVTGGKDLASPGRRRLKGRSARIIVTMGMPAFIYRLFYGAHSLKSFKRNILAFCGIRPVRSTVIGLAGGNERARGKWLQRMRALGSAGR